MNKLLYRKEIDGLKGLCVISVVLYHLEVPFFQGGFFGVDIFFLISGYLITQILLDRRNGLINFYEGRIRRILPPLFVCLLFTSIFIFFFYKDNFIFKDYALSVISSIFFLSNYFFNQSVNYFNSVNAFHPLLHTWSLSIEEQFYLLYPIILFIFIKFFKKKIVYLFTFFILINVILVQFSGNLKFNYPFVEDKFFFFNQSTYFNFFSPLARLWEFLMGAVIYFLRLGKNKINNYINTIFLPVSYFFILYSITNFYYDNYLPNIYTLLPLISSFIILLYENKKSLTYKIITNKLLTFFGIISFSLYLWHHSLISIINYLYTDLNLYNKFAILIVCFLISIISWRFVEIPFRNKKTVNKISLYIFLIILLLINIFLAFLIYNDNSKKEYIRQLFLNYSFARDLNNNFKDDEIKLRLKNNLEVIQKDSSKINNILIIGDSHGVDFSNVVRNNESIKKKNNINFYNIEPHHFKKNNLDEIQKVNYFFKSDLFTTANIIIVSDFISPNSTPKFIRNNLDGIKYLNSVIKGNKKVILVNQSPFFLGSSDPVRTVILKNHLDQNFSEKVIGQEIYKLIPKMFFTLNNDIFNFAQKEKIILFDIFDIFCDKVDKDCMFKTNQNELIFFDGNHISQKGAEYISQNPKFLKLLEKN